MPARGAAEGKSHTTQPVKMKADLGCLGSSFWWAPRLPPGAQAYCTKPPTDETGRTPTAIERRLTLEHSHSHGDRRHSEQEGQAGKNGAGAEAIAKQAVQHEGAGQQRSQLESVAGDGPARAQHAEILRERAEEGEHVHPASHLHARIDSHGTDEHRCEKVSSRNKSARRSHCEQFRGSWQGGSCREGIVLTGEGPEAADERGPATRHTTEPAYQTRNNT